MLHFSLQIVTRLWTRTLHIVFYYILARSVEEQHMYADRSIHLHASISICIGLAPSGELPFNALAPEIPTTHPPT